MILSFLVRYVVGLLIGAAVFSLSSGSALRGGKPSKQQDVFLRLVFFAAFCWPMAVYTPYCVPLMALYLITYLDGSESSPQGRPSLLCKRSYVWKWFAHKLMDCRIVKTTDLSPKKQYVFGLHPHGILPFCSAFTIGTEANGFQHHFPGIDNIRGLVASIVFYVPIYRDLVLAGGGADVSKHSADSIMKAGQHVWIAPGGATEALYSTPLEDRLHLNSRFGFVKLALQHGAELVPVFSFGETESFNTLSSSYPLAARFQRKMQNVFGTCIPFITNIVPRRIPITCVIGGPVALPRALQTPGQPTDEEVKELHGLYVQALRAMYDEYGPKLNSNPEKKLIIV